MMSPLLLCALLCALHGARAHLPFLSDKFIDEINSKQTSWRAGRNFLEDTPLAHIRRLAGTLLSPHSPPPPLRRHERPLVDSLPDSFDAREQWPECPSLFEIRDQGSCGSCWAHGAVEAMTDRICIHSKGAKQPHLSAQDLVSCFITEAYGCGGGPPASAWQYWIDHGIVTGGNYSYDEGCRPYEVPPCEHFEKGNRIPCTPNYVPTPPCKSTCRSGYEKSYNEDKVFGKSVYLVNGEDDIRAEIFKNGPVEASFKVYEDFLHYKSGVYVHTQGDAVGGHAIKIIGWGEEGGKKYWLISNSWNSDWGDGGYVKMLRGVDHCGIEIFNVAGEPL